MWQVEFGASGGYTGGGTGYRIASDGTVSRWTVSLAGEPPVYEAVGTAPVADLEAALGGLEGVHLDEPSNMTGTFKWPGGSLQWPIGASLPVPVEVAVEAAKTAVRAAGSPPPPGL